MVATLLVLSTFAVLLVIDWTRGSWVARAGAVVLALVVLSFSQPIPGRAARRALSVPKAERVLRLPNWGPLSDYTSGVMTMRQAMREDMAIGANGRRLGVGVLVWLSVSPVVQSFMSSRRRPTSPEPVA